MTDENEQIILAVRGYAHRHLKTGKPTGQIPDFTLHAGECVLLCGPSGSGKTTFLLTAAGLMEPRRVVGQVERLPYAPDAPPPGHTGIVLQNPDTQLLCSTVWEEAAFGPVNMGLSDDEVASRVREALAAMELTAFAGRPVDALSMGQKHRLAIAATLSMRPNLLLLDEPYTQLDPQGRELLSRAIGDILSQGGGVVVSEHVSSFLDGVATARVDIGINEPAVRPASLGICRSEGQGGDVPLLVEGLRHGYGGAEDIICGVDLFIAGGQKVLVSGVNGGGKSTLLRCMVGALSPRAGEVTVCGISSPRPAELAMRIGFLGQNPEAQLFEDSVLEEVAFSLCRSGLKRQAAKAQALALLEAFGLLGLADSAPLALSFGQKHLVALASILATGPRLVLLDEPFTGLAENVRDAVLGILDTYVHETGAAALMVSHDPRCPDWADAAYILKDGILHGA